MLRNVRVALEGMSCESTGQLRASRNLPLDIEPEATILVYLTRSAQNGE